jgi:UDP-2,3-diacylglucosamine hydrolase
MHSLFVSDLHLCRARPRTTQIFLRFLQEVAPQAEALYILGDLFEYWVGDDDLAEPHHAEITQALARLAGSGTSVFLLHGNRDFLIGETFARSAGVRLLDEPTLIDLYGVPTLLTHGDTLCGDDSDYLAFRTKVRDPAWQNDFLAQPLAQRKALIEHWRGQSEQEKQHKPAAIMDANPDTIADTLRRYGYPRLIHGHTHRPAKHSHSVDGRVCERWVLPAWCEEGGYLRCDRDGCQAIQFG